MEPSMEISVEGLAEACKKEPELLRLFADAVDMCQKHAILSGIRLIAKEQGPPAELLEERIRITKGAAEQKIGRLYEALEAAKVPRFPKFDLSAFAAHCLPGQETSQQQ